VLLLPNLLYFLANLIQSAEDYKSDADALIKVFISCIDFSTVVVLQRLEGYEEYFVAYDSTNITLVEGST